MLYRRQTATCFTSRFCSSNTTDAKEGADPATPNRYQELLHQWNEWKMTKIASPDIVSVHESYQETSEDVWPTPGFGRVKASGEVRVCSEDVLLTSLDEDQRAAVIAPLDKPLYIQGAAGTGKTKVLQRRLLHLVTEHGVDPSSILCVNFNSRGAEEFRAAVKKIAPQFLPTLSISTLQSLSYAILLKHYHEAGFDTPPTVTTDVEELSEFTRKAWFAAYPLEVSTVVQKKYPSVAPSLPSGPVDWNHPELKAFWDKILTDKEYTDLSEEDREDFLNWNCPNEFCEGGLKVQTDILEDKKKGLDLTSSGLPEPRRKAWAKYQELLRSKGVVDPADVCMLALQLLRKTPEIVELMRNRFSYLLIDNFEDITLTQMELCLCLNTPSITVAGDEDQSVFQSCNATPNAFGILKVVMEKLGYGEHTQAELPLNHRSSPQVLKLAGSILEPAKEFHSVKSDDDHSTKMSVFGNINEQADSIATKLLMLHHDKTWRNCAILLPIMVDLYGDNLSPIRQALEKRKIPFVVRTDDPYTCGDAEVDQGPDGFLNHHEFKDLLAYLRLTVDVHDDMAFQHALSRPIRPGLVKDSKLFLAMTELRKTPKVASLFDAAKKLLADRSREPGTSINALREFVDQVIPALQAASARSVEETIELACKMVGYREFRKKEIWPRSKARQSRELRVLKVLLDMANVFDSSYTQERRMVDFLSLMKPLSRKPLPRKRKIDDVVTITGIHQSKGQEWDYVFVPNFEPRLLPSPNQKKEFITPEDRRLYHVACTRVRKILFLSSLNR